ncbi:hypothetical protein B566_EDAN018702, partial [Ephemera danica]
MRQSCKAKKNCPTCHREFMTNSLLQEHRKLCKPDRSVCNKCDKTFVYKSLKNKNDEHLNATSSEKPICSPCKTTFSSYKQLKYHMNNTCPHRNGTSRLHFTCERCNKTFMLEKYLKQHMKRNCKATQKVICSACQQSIPEDKLLHHKSMECSNCESFGGTIYRQSQDLPTGVVESASGFKRAVTNYDIINNDDTTDIATFLEDSRNTITQIIEHDLT